MSSLSSSTVSARPGTPSTPISVLASNAARASSHRRSRAGRTAIVLALPVMIETTPPAAAHRHSWSTNGSGLLEVPEHAVAQHGGEASAVDRLFGVLAVGLQRASPVAGPRRAAAGVAVAPCPASPATDRATSRRSRLGPAETTDGPHRRRRRARTPAAAAGARAAAGASRRCARTPSPRHRPHRRTGRPDRPRCHRPPHQDTSAHPGQLAPVGGAGDSGGQPKSARKAVSALGKLPSVMSSRWLLS